ncbi:MAG: DNA replication and repair protein RecF [Saccharofermentans sp.]|nr:DNA replication and repair protein RecF [Saccharofermentans sp.]
MFIRSIHLENFRNYGRLDLDVGPSVNIFYGDNAQGKTNLVEGIYVASSIASHRTSKDSDLIKFGENEYKTSLDLQDDDGALLSLSACYYTEKSALSRSNRIGRVLLRDNAPVEKISEYIGVCNIVIFAPEDLNIVKNAPAFRRKFLNTLISKISPSYFNLLSNYSRLLSQKNALLKNIRGGNGISSSIDQQLDFWDFSLADVSAEIILKRYKFSKLISDIASKHHRSISGGKENLAIEYSTIFGATGALETFLNENSKYDEYISKGLTGADYGRIKGILSDLVLAKLKSVREYDIDKHISSSGIHRDDIIIKLDGMPMKNFSSQGQQRTAALALKLAELEIIKMYVSSTPVLILDDVFSELDKTRRLSLVSAMKGAQIFITCTDKNMIGEEIDLMQEAGARKAVFYRVSGGVIEAE